MTDRSILHRITLPAPQHLVSPPQVPSPRSPTTALAEVERAQAQITETIVVIRRAVAENAPSTHMPGTDAELEDVVFDDDMLVDARAAYVRPRGHLTRRLSSLARETRAAAINSVILIRLARRPFATVQARVEAVAKRGKVLDVLVLNGPDGGRLVCAELGMTFPWDVLV